jgi:hypothetical protein
LAEAGPKTTISLQLESIPGGDKDCVSSLPNGFGVQLRATARPLQRLVSTLNHAST